MSHMPYETKLSYFKPFKILFYSVEAQFRELDEIGESVKTDIGNIRSQTTASIQVLERELSIVTAWKNNAEKMDSRLETLSLDNFERLPLYRKSFLRAVVALRESAEDFLDQPIVLFTLEEDVKEERHGGTGNAKMLKTARR